MPASPVSAEPGRVVVFATSWCPFCLRLRDGLDGQRVSYDLVDVEQDAAAAAFVESVNGGDRIVPTVLFPDETTLTNPEARQVAERLGR